MERSEVVPGLASMLAAAGGALVALLSPFYAVLDFADDKDGSAWSLVGLTLLGLLGAWSGVWLRRGGILPPVAMMAFALACAAAGIVVQVHHGSARTALLLGALGVALPLFLIAEKGWLSPSSEAPLSDG